MKNRKLACVRCKARGRRGRFICLRPRCRCRWSAFLHEHWECLNCAYLVLVFTRSDRTERIEAEFYTKQFLKGA